MAFDVVPDLLNRVEFRGIGQAVGRLCARAGMRVVGTRRQVTPDTVPHMRQLCLRSATWKCLDITNSMRRSGNIGERSVTSRKSCPSRKPSLSKQ